MKFDHLRELDQAFGISLLECRISKMDIFHWYDKNDEIKIGIEVWYEHLSTGKIF